jgi:hypothetical protein
MNYIELCMDKKTGLLLTIELPMQNPCGLWPVIGESKPIQEQLLAVYWGYAENAWKDLR